MDPELRRAAVDRAYREHVDDVFRVAYSILRDSEAAVDATHDAFARAFERWDRYDPGRPLRPWLLAIAARIALDLLRRRRTHDVAVASLRRDALAAGAWTVAGPGGPAPTANRDLVEAALATLRPSARAAVVLRHYYGYDYVEIGRILGTSTGNVGALLSRAHAALRERLAGSEPGASTAGRLGGDVTAVDGGVR